MANLWGGRFQAAASELMQEFNESFSMDKRLWSQDINASIAHVKMLGDCQIITSDESIKLQEALAQLHLSIEKNPALLSGNYEDIHSFVEAKMTDELGDIGKKMHTARSRNDQVATDMKLYVKDSLHDLIDLTDKMMHSFLAKGQQVNALMPAYTHLQRAQIVPFSYVLQAYVSMFERDIIKMNDAIHLMDESPLGAGALAGTTYDINREQTAHLMGFSRGVQINTLDAVSSRDFVIDALHACASIMMHMSRFAEDFIIYSSQEFAFVECSDTFATGSSMMPQKKNPDALELIRGKSAKVISLLNAMYVTMKGLPLTYNKDMQEDKAIYFEAYDTTAACIKILTALVSEMTVNEDRLNQTIHEGYLNATELADYLVRKGIPFRDAHGIVGELVVFAIDKQKQLHQLELSELQSFSAKIEADVYQALDPNTILNQGIKKEMLK